MKHIYYFGGGAIFIILFGVFIAYPIIDNGDIYRFKLNQYSLDGGLEIPDRLCFAKVSNIATVGGQPFDSQQSKFATGHPTLNQYSFFFEDDVNVIDGFIIEPKLKCISGIGSSVKTGTTQEKADALAKLLEQCEIDPHGTNCDASNAVTMVIDSANLSLKVISEDIPNDTKITTFANTIKTNQVEVLDGTEVKLASFKVKAIDLEDDLSVGQYQSWQEFRVFGTITMHPKICNSCVFSYYIPEEGMPTYYQITVAKNDPNEKTVDTNNDGIPDTNKSGQQNDAVEKETEKQETERKSSGAGITDLQEFTDCLILNDTDCLNQGKFAMLWFGIIALAGLFGLGVLFAIFQGLTKVRNN